MYRSIHAVAAVIFLVAPVLHADPAPVAVNAGDIVRIGGHHYQVQIVNRKASKTITEDGNFACQENGIVTVYDRTSGTIEKPISFPWPLLELSSDRNWAAIDDSHDPNMTRQAIVDVHAAKIAIHLPDGLQVFQWKFTGRYAVPVRGDGPLCIVDLQSGKVDKLPLPKLPAHDDSWGWSGWVDAKEPRATLFLNSQQRVKCYRADIDLAHPERCTFEPTEFDGFIKHLASGQILVAIRPREYAQPSDLAIVTNGDWHIQKQFPEDSDRARALEGTPSPDGKESWYIDSQKGATIYDLSSAKPIAQAPGSFANARSLGVVFADGGALALVATPYDGLVSIVRTADHQILNQFKTPDGSGPAGAMLIASKDKDGIGQFVVFDDPLPFE